MGNYAERISQRLRHARIKHGYCVICGKHGLLTPDHVPPKGSIVVTKVEQRHIVETMGASSHLIKGIVSPNGSYFRTICQECNNIHVGCGDKEIAEVNKRILAELRFLDYQPLNRGSEIEVAVNSLLYARAMIGHILSATSVEECKSEIHSSPYFDPLREFVLGDDDAISNTHEIYYWFYPFRMHLSAKFVGFKNCSQISCLSILSFFPVSFMVAKKGEATYPAHARVLSLTDTRLVFDISSDGFQFAEFPFVELKGDQLMTLKDCQAICSYPLGN